MNTTIEQDIETLTNLPVTDWEKGFLNSIKEGMAKYSRLTDKQQVVFDKIADKYLDENGKVKEKAASSAPKSNKKLPPQWLLARFIEQVDGEIKKDAERLLGKLLTAPKAAAPQRSAPKELDDEFLKEVKDTF